MNSAVRWVLWRELWLGWKFPKLKEKLIQLHCISQKLTLRDKFSTVRVNTMSLSLTALTEIQDPLPTTG